MAMRAPETFLSDPPRRRHARAAFLLPERATSTDYAEGGLFRLAETHRQTLRDVAEGVEESDVGVCCSYLRDLASGEGADYDEHALAALERYAESAIDFADVSLDGERLVPRVRAWRGRVLRARRALALLRRDGEHRAPSVLMVYYGHPDPFVRSSPIGDALGLRLGSLARYTDALEARRLELVRDEVARRAPRLEEGEKLVDLARRIAIREHAERAVSSADALRAAFAAYDEPAVRPLETESPRETEARRDARRERQAAYAARVATFTTTLRIEATRMLSDAERSYHAAWLRSATR